MGAGPVELAYFEHGRIHEAEGGLVYHEHLQKTEKLRQYLVTGGDEAAVAWETGEVLAVIAPDILIDSLKCVLAQSQDVPDEDSDYLALSEESWPAALFTWERAGQEVVYKTIKVGDMMSLKQRHG
jgi:hypothetical protein